MALEFAHGAIAWNAADVATTTYVVNTLSFQPKAMLFVIHGQQSAVDATSEAISGRFGIGFAASASDRRCVGMIDTDAAATMDCGTAHHNAAIAVTVTAAGVIDGLLDLTALASNGFTLTVDDAAPVNLTVFWFAWGGTDITNVETLDIVEPGATGDQDYGTFKPDHVFFAGSQATTANTGRAEAAGIMFGGGYPVTAVSQQWVFATNQDDASAAADTDRYGISSECVALMVLAGGNPDVRGAMTTTQPASAFRVNWAAVTAGARRFIAMAIKGGRWRAGTILSDAATVTVASLPFTPQGAILASHGTTEQAAGISTTEGVLCIGGFSSITSRRGMGYRSENATASSAAEVNLAIDYDQVIVYPSAAGGLDTALDVSAINSDGFDLTRDAGSTNMAVGFVTWADAPVAVAWLPRRGSFGQDTRLRI